MEPISPEGLYDTATIAVPPINQPAPARPRVWPCYVSFIIVIVEMFAVGLVLGVGYLIYELVKTGKPPTEFNGEALETQPWILASSVVGMFVVLMSAAVIPPLIMRKPVRERLSLGPARLPWGVLCGGILGATAYSAAIDAIYQLLAIHSRSMTNIDRAIEGANPAWSLILLLTIGIIGPISEEFYCRGYLQTRLVRRHGPMLGIFITSVLFAILHMDLYHSLFAFGFGMYLGVMAYRAESILPTIAAHAFNNSSSVIFTWCVPAGGRQAQIIVLIVGTLIAAVMMIMTLYWPQRAAIVV